MRGIPVIGLGLAAIVGVIALIIAGAFWAAKHPSDSKEDRAIDEESNKPSAKQYPINKK